MYIFFGRILINIAFINKYFTPYNTIFYRIKSALYDENMCSRLKHEK